MLSASEKLMRAIWGIEPRDLVDYPFLVDGSTTTILEELSRTAGKYKTLSLREQRVLLLRFGFDSGTSRTLKEVGREFNVEKERIRQIEARALRKLRHPSHSRRLSPLLYQPTKDDQRAVAMRGRLCDELSKFFPGKPAYEIVMGIKRPYLRRALRDLTRGNIARQVRLSCGLSLRYCKQCGAITLPNWDFCSPECEREYHTLMVICDGCGQLFPRQDKIVVRRLGKRGYQYQFCSRPCMGRYAGKHWGFGAHPENTGSRTGGRSRKWNYSQIYTMRDNTGWGAVRISRALGIPEGTVSVILAREQKH